MIEEYLNELKINGKADKTLSNTRTALKGLNELKPLDQVTKADLMEHFKHLEETSMEATYSLKKRLIKKFYKDIGKEDLVSWIKISRDTGTLDADDILNITEINMLIEYTDSHMYKALMAVLFETGGRISEILNLTVNDIQDDENGMIIKIENIKTRKTATAKHRKMLLLFSAQYARNWIAYGGLKKSDRLFPITQSGIWRYFSKLKKDTGIQKPINPHRFRHASATDAVRRGYQESIIRKKLGWTPDSKMIARYVHLIDDDIIEHQRKMSGDVIEKVKLPDLKMTECINVADRDSIIQKQAAKMEEMGKQISEMERMFNDPSIIEAMISKRVDEILKTKT